MFTNIELENFKAYDHLATPLRPLTILLGPNNAGKSSILQALLLLKQTIDDRVAQATLVTAGKDVDLGSVRDLVRKSSSAEPKTLRFALKIAPWMVPETQSNRMFHSTPADELDLLFQCGLQANRVALKTSTWKKDGKTVLGVAKGRTGWRLTGARVSPDFITADVATILPSVALTEAFGQSRGPVSSFRHVVEAYTNSQINFTYWKSVFDSLWHVSPLRADIPRIAQLGKVVTSDLGMGGERLLIELRGTAKKGERQGLIDKINKWVNRHPLLVNNLRLQDLDRTGTVVSLVADDVSGTRGINVANMGMGISQVLPILANVLRNDGGCGLIQQPELHLHPAAQAEIADLFVDHIIESPRNQLIVETHSEHLLLRIRKHIAAGHLMPDQVAIISVTKKDGISHAKPLTIREDSGIEDWPDGFFEEGYREALAVARAYQERQEREAKAGTKKVTRRRKTA
jgi:predicted ATPase